MAPIKKLWTNILNLMCLAMMVFDGYGAQLFGGLMMTSELAVLALLLAFFLGLMSAAASLILPARLAFLPAIYTTLIRAMPDLVLMLILFYGIQLGVNHLAEAVEVEPIMIDPFSAGVITLGFIYGAYFSETFRGAFLSLPRGAIEAAEAFGMSKMCVFTRHIFPLLMRFALPGIANNWQVLLKSTALVSLIGLNDLVRIAEQAGEATHRPFFFIAVSAISYLLITIVSMAILTWLQRKYTAGLRMAEL